MRDPSRYAGRDDLVREAYEYLMHGRSLFVAGRRGVGKSSFAAQVQQLVSGSADAKARFAVDTVQSSLNVTYRCDGTERLGEFASRLLHAVERAAGQRLAVAGKTAEKLKVNLKLVSYEIGHQQSEEIPDLTTRFSEVLIDWMRQLQSCDKAQVIIWIDEADLLIAKVKIGVFLKVVLENLSDAHIDNLSFGLVGISSGLTELKEQHPSITRFVMPIYVPPMLPEELVELLDRALDPTPVVFEGEVREALYVLSQGFPDPVHLLGYELFAAAITNLHTTATPKTLEDVLTKVTTTIKKEELRSIQTRIPDQHCEKLIYAAAMQGDEYTTAGDLALWLGWPEDRCREICAQLCALQFLEPEGRKGFRFVDPLFRIYLKMLEAQHTADLHRAHQLAKKTYHETSGDVATRALSKATDGTILKLILDNYRRTGRSGMGPKMPD